MVMLHVHGMYSSHEPMGLSQRMSWRYGSQPQRALPLAGVAAAVTGGLGVHASSLSLCSSARGWPAYVRAPLGRRQPDDGVQISGQRKSVATRRCGLDQVATVAAAACGSAAADRSLAILCPRAASILVKMAAPRQSSDAEV